jgi:5-methylcytosine-specific restriction endonuclease McrA
MTAMLTGEAISQLFGYQASSRSLTEGAGYGIGLDTTSVEELAKKIRQALPLLGNNEEAVVRELGEIIRFRIIFSLLPSQCLFDAPDESKPIIKEHLREFGIEPNDDLVRAIKFFCDNFQAKRGSNPGKWGVTDVFIRTRHIYNEIFERQHGRCVVCGEPLIYGQNMHLDHILPFHLGDDPPDGSNWQFLCNECNIGKGVDPFYSLGRTGANWIAPNSENRLTTAIRFAVLTRDRACTKSGQKPSETKLVPVKLRPSGSWILDNCTTLSEKFARTDAQ